MNRNRSDQCGLRAVCAWSLKKRISSRIKPPRRRKRAKRRVNLFIDAKAGVDKDASGDEETDDENNDLD